MAQWVDAPDCGARGQVFQATVCFLGKDQPRAPRACVANASICLATCSALGELYGSTVQLEKGDW